MAGTDYLGFAQRLRTVLPARWFPDQSSSPVLEALLEGLGATWAWAYSQLVWVAAQSRIATATGSILDIAARDYLGGRIVRRRGEPDASLSARIRAEIIRPRATRAAVIQALTDLTGRVPVVVEPARPTDTGGIGHLGMTLGTGLAIGGTGVSGAGAVGSIELPFQAFVHAYRASGGGIPNVGGIYLGSGWAGGGIGSLSNPGAAGAFEVASLDMSQGQITDADIFATVSGVLPVGTIAWTAITN